MLTIKLMKYAMSRELSGDKSPSHTEAISIRQAATVHLRFEPDGRQVLQLGDAPGDTIDITIGERHDCAYNVAYVMNDAGKTIDTIR